MEEMARYFLNVHILDNAPNTEDALHFNLKEASVVVRKFKNGKTLGTYQIKVKICFWISIARRYQ